MIKVTIEGKSWTVESLTSEDAPADMKQALISCYVSGKQPEIVPVAPLPPLPMLAVPFPENANDASEKPTIDVSVARRVFSDWGATVVDVDAKARIDAQQAALRKAGVTGVGFKDEGGDGDQFFANGTRMMSEGYAEQDKRKAEHDAQADVRDAAHDLIKRITDEHREDVDLSAGEFGRMLVANGKVSINGRALTEQAIRGLAARLESPFLGYVLGLRDRCADAWSRKVKAGDASEAEMYRALIKADTAKIADVLAHECKRNPDVALKLRTRNGQINDVFAIVSQQYAPADAPAVVGRLVDKLSSEHPGAKGKVVYDAATTSWELQAEVWTPTPTEKQAVGEAFRGYASLRGRDNGTGRASGSGGIELLRCLNASVYTANAAKVSRVHRGKILDDLSLMIDGAIAACSILASAWGKNREIVIPLTDEERKQGDKFMTGLWMSTLRDDRILAGVLPGRVVQHAEALTANYNAERREPNLLVRADMAQAWTRYIQGQPMNVRKDAEDAIGKWLVTGGAV
jgi:hypothetical protein